MADAVATTREGLPLLAYVYHPHSFATFALVGAALNVCELVWVVDTSNPEVASMSRLLARSGPVVDVANLTYDEAAVAIAAHAPDGILSLADDLLNWTAEVAQRLGLAFLTPETTRRLTDKHAQRRALAAGGLVVPGFSILNEGGGLPSWTAIGNGVSFPAVLKPRRGEGSRDTFLIASLDELRDLWQRLSATSSPSREFVIEEFIPDAIGPVAGEGFAGYVSVESFVCNTKITHLAINGRMPPAFPFRETGFFIPSALDAASSHAVLNVATSAIAAVGVTVGCLHTEIKLTETGPVVIEVNGRIGGGVPEMLAEISDIRFVSIAMQLALGETVTHEAMPDLENVGYLFYVQAPAEMHTVASIDGLTELSKVVGVSEIIMNRGPGQSVDWHEGNHGHVVSVLGVVANHDELRALNQRISSLVRIEGE